MNVITERIIEETKRSTLSLEAGLRQAVERAYAEGALRGYDVAYDVFYLSEQPECSWDDLMDDERYDEVGC